MPLEYTAPTTLLSHNTRRQQHCCHTTHGANNTAVTQYTAPTTLLSHKIRRQQHCCHTTYGANNTAVTQHMAPTTLLSHNTRRQQHCFHTIHVASRVAILISQHILSCDQITKSDLNVSVNFVNLIP
jgi:hypothetical protein